MVVYERANGVDLDKQLNTNRINIIKKGQPMIQAYPKIFTIGTDYISNIFDNNVEISEKVDGSQFNFGKINNELFMRSKGAQLFAENPEPMFRHGIDHVLSIQHRIPNNTIFFCEYLKKPKHNTLAYDKIPKNHLVLFAVCGTDQKFHSQLQTFSEPLEIDSIPILYNGLVDNVDKLMSFLETESYLGGTDVEGIVVKNYSMPFLLGRQLIPVMAGKFVSEKFKEVHRNTWGKKHTGKGRWETFKESFCTEARWQKSVQHLCDSGLLESSPRDIGSLIREVQRDIIEEEKENIKNFLWKEFGKEVIRSATKGFPEWYKLLLAEKSFK